MLIYSVNESSIECSDQTESISVKNILGKSYFKQVIKYERC